MKKLVLSLVLMVALVVALVGCSSEEEYVLVYGVHNEKVALVSNFEFKGDLNDLSFNREYVYIDGERVELYSYAREVSIQNAQGRTTIYQTQYVIKKGD